MRAVVQRVTFADVTVFDPEEEEVAMQAMDAGIYEDIYNPPDPLSDELYTGRSVGGIPVTILLDSRKKF